DGFTFRVMSLSVVGEPVVRAIVYALRIAITSGIVVFIAFIGLKGAGVVVGNPATLVGPGDFTSGPVALALGGIALTLVLVARRVPGATVLSSARSTRAGLCAPDGRGGAGSTGAG